MGSMTSASTRRRSSTSTASRSASGTRRSGWMTGRMARSTVGWCMKPETRPSPSNSCGWRAHHEASTCRTRWPRASVNQVVPGTEEAAGDRLDVHRVDRKERPSMSSTATRCTNCGSSAHTTGNQSCPARGKRCRNCDKLNHFARVCRSVPAPSGTAVPINTVHGPQTAFKYLTCTVNGQPIQLLVDSGAKVSILNKHTYDRFFSHTPLQPTTKPLAGYGHSPISVQGVARLRVSYGDQSTDSEFPVKHKGAATVPRPGICHD